MLPVLNFHSRRVTYVRCGVAWICVLSLILVLANRVPRIQGCEGTSWISSAPSQISARVLAKDFFVLFPPACGSNVLLYLPPCPLELREEGPLVSFSLDNRIFTRPPPRTWAERAAPKNVSLSVSGRIQ